MKKIFYILNLIILSFSLIFLTSCDNKEYEIVTTLFPQYDFTNQIVGDKLNVKLLPKAGSEVHNYEPTAKDIEMIKNSKLFIYTSDVMETWVSDLLKSNPDINYLDLSKNITLIDSTHSHEEDDESKDPHYWTSPINASIMIDEILEEVIKLDNSNKDFYTTNATNYKNEILKVHEDLKTLLLNQNKTIYYAGHNALGYFAKEYGLNIVVLDPQYENGTITSSSLKSMIDSLKETNPKYLFIAELSNTYAADTIKEEYEKDTKNTLEIKELHGYHNVTSEQLKNKVSYLDLLESNYNYLKDDLN